MVTKLKSFMQAQSYSDLQAAALLIIRIIVGVAMILHGWGKIQNPFGWMGPDAAVPGILQFLAALSEFGGGIALVLGLLFRVASIGLVITMLVATLLHAVIKGDPFVGMGGPSYELALVYFGISILFLVMGPGKFSIDKVIFGTK